MPGCPALLLLTCGSLAASHPVFWLASRTSSPGTAGRSSHLERSRLAGRNMASEGNDQHKRNTTAIPRAASRDVTRKPLLPKYYCPSNSYFRCPDMSSIRRFMLKEKFTESLRDAGVGRALVEKAVLQALGGRYRTGYRHQEGKKTPTKDVTTMEWNKL